ncbi:D-alanyl-D-alanine carboxypeptidase [Aquipluma nitroreducens]|uniref:D-alanyl-D-alanine carboxypeptidase n=1 Tax=Aquipluma nitroreducens TaxID=2010828 RepID=A0A5K7S608_9BACT|nr:D-alanyl-D-alanine carboxypeptidase/D-alanyl-D-alanine-endopeptidase [Aquipluma nitroreducens]BBE16937.1 D-alanyl-D-alanine carboxypeptidase [Aquipluma nitroreducens]
MRTSFFFTCILALWATFSTAQNSINTAQQKVAGWQTTSGLANASICISVSDNQTNSKLIESKPQLSLVPASILKTITTATALEVFGPEFRFQTTLSYSGTVHNDTLFGNLQIIGGGDPTLGSMYFPENKNFMDEWVKAIGNNHIRVITGNLIVDATIYEKVQVPGSWVWEDLGNYFGAGASGISVFDNMYEIHLKSGGEADNPTQILRVIPEIQNLELTNEVLSSDVNSDQSYVFGSPEDNKRVIRGTIPKNQSDFVVKASVPNPSVLLASEFRKKILANGIVFSGETKFEKAVGSGKLSVIQSPPLRHIIRVTNHESVNLFAEHFLKHLAFQKTGLGTTKDGCLFVVQFWKDKGLDMTGFFMNDGSGLSRFNAITANQMVDILNYMKTKSLYSTDFYKSLPTAGNGTLTAFSTENFPQDCLHAKSGSMTRVRCYAGYLTTESGRQLSFAVMLNNFSFSQKEASKKIEELLVELRKL